jgi:uncharacterized OB-fold protein
MTEPVAPIVNDLSRPFWTAAANGRLALPFCIETGRPFWPPSPTSPFTRGGVVEWREVPAEGLLTARVTYRRAFQHTFAHRLPYAIALVEVAPGVRISAHLSDPDGPDSPRPGTPVKLAFAPLSVGGVAVPIVAGAGDG